jgi:hypothetical protein
VGPHRHPEVRELGEHDLLGRDAEVQRRRQRGRRGECDDRRTAETHDGGAERVGPANTIPTTKNAPKYALFALGGGNEPVHHAEERVGDTVERREDQRRGAEARGARSRMRDRSDQARAAAGGDEDARGEGDRGDGGETRDEPQVPYPIGLARLSCTIRNSAEVGSCRA